MLDPESILDLEELGREEFAAQAHLFLPPGLLFHHTSKLWWWTLMQHYHAPTRLLDWSYSPYVAAYFACADRSAIDGAIWVLDVRTGIFEMPEDFDFGNEVEDMFVDSAAEASSLRLLVQGPRNQRMMAQQGVFMFSDQVGADHHKVLLHLSRSRRNKWSFGKLRIPAAQKIDFLEQLSFMNINARSLYPGIDGLGQSILETISFEARRRRALN